MTHGPLCPKTLKILGSGGVKINLLIKQFFFLCGKKAKIVDSKIIGSKKILSFKIQCKNIFFSFLRKKGSVLQLTFLPESIRADICPSRINCVSSSSRDLTVQLNDVAILFKSADT